ncbi:MAG: hypothetical protein V3T65_03125 [Acidobacteriota bacterium]
MAKNIYPRNFSLTLSPHSASPLDYSLDYSLDSWRQFGRSVFSPLFFLCGLAALYCPNSPHIDQQGQSAERRTGTNFTQPQ